LKKPSTSSVRFPRNLSHTQSIRIGRDAGDLHSSRAQLHEEKYEIALESLCRPDFDREKVDATI
jgi:hypothetical protein